MFQILWDARMSFSCKTLLYGTYMYYRDHMIQTYPGSSSSLTVSELVVVPLLLFLVEDLVTLEDLLSIVIMN